MSAPQGGSLRLWGRVVPLGLGLGVVPTSCTPAPGPCLGLKVGDELVMTVEETQSGDDSPCDFAALGLTVGTQLRLSVDEQLWNGTGESVYCSVSTGDLRTDTGWTYKRSWKPPPMEGGYGLVADGTNGKCAGELELEVYADQEPASVSTPWPARAYVAYSPKTCPSLCFGKLIGPLVRAP
jgi:hypothetical protein